jgi:hypothetical protein
MLMLSYGILCQSLSSRVGRWGRFCSVPDKRGSLEGCTMNEIEEGGNGGRVGNSFLHSVRGLHALIVLCSWELRVCV